MKPLLRMLRIALRDRPRLRRSALFDARWYRDSYPDIGRADPAWHYLAHGAAEGRDPGPGFSTSGARLRAPGTGNPLLGYERSGRDAGQLALPVFAGTQQPAAGAAAILFCGHQALGQQFGAERSLLDMLDHAGAAGLAVHVVLPQILDPGYLAAVRSRAIAVHIIPCPWYRSGRSPHPVTLAALERVIRSSGALEVHQNTLVLDAPLIAARRAGVPAVVWLRELPAGDPELCARMATAPAALHARLLAGADRFIANSAATAAWIDPEGAAAPGRVTVLPNRVDPALKALPFAPPARPRIGLIGSLRVKKGIADFIAVATALQQRGVPAEFRLYGPDSDDLRAFGTLPDGVIHAGYTASPVDAIAGLDVVLSLSHFAESFGRTVTEAMAAGRPVICYDRGTPAELVGCSGAGQVVPADDPQAVATALRALLTEPGALQTASVAARLRFAELDLIGRAVPPERIYPDALARAG